MKKVILTVAALGICLAAFGLLFQPATRIIWNRTESAPTGLYRLSDDPFTLSRWVIVSAGSAEAQWAARRGYVGDSWPLMKRVAALPGAEICRHSGVIFINGERVAIARQRDASGMELPVWSGCRRLENDELFLLNPHPRSLDGRYFGPTRMRDVDGVAVPVFLFSDP